MMEKVEAPGFEPGTSGLKVRCSTGLSYASVIGILEFVRTSIHPRSMAAPRRQPPLGIQRRHATGAGGGHRLSVIVVGHVARRKDTLNARRGSLRRGPFDVTNIRQRQLALEEIDVRRVADGQE